MAGRADTQDLSQIPRADRSSDQGALASLSSPAKLMRESANRGLVHGTLLKADDLRGQIKAHGELVGPISSQFYGELCAAHQRTYGDRFVYEVAPSNVVSINAQAERELAISSVDHQAVRTTVELLRKFQGSGSLSDFYRAFSAAAQSMSVSKASPVSKT